MPPVSIATEWDVPGHRNRCPSPSTTRIHTHGRNPPPLQRNGPEGPCPQFVKEVGVCNNRFTGLPSQPEG